MDEGLLLKPYCPFFLKMKNIISENSVKYIEHENLMFDITIYILCNASVISYANKKPGKCPAYITI